MESIDTNEKNESERFAYLLRPVAGGDYERVYYDKHKLKIKHKPEKAEGYWLENIGKVVPLKQHLQVEAQNAKLVESRLNTCSRSTPPTKYDWIAAAAFVTSALLNLAAIGWCLLGR